MISIDLFKNFYWHTSHSLLLLITTDLSHLQSEQEQTLYKSECSCRLQWQSQLHFLHLFILIFIYSILMDKLFWRWCVGGSIAMIIIVCCIWLLLLLWVWKNQKLFIKSMARRKSLSKKQIEKNKAIILKFATRLIILAFLVVVIIYALPS